MFKTITLGLLGFILVVCWIGSVSDSRHGETYIVVNDESLFIGFSILLAGWLVALNLPSSSKTKRDRLASDYVRLTTTLNDQSLTIEQLNEELGETRNYVQSSSGEGRIEKGLSEEQTRSLQQLIYEGKIILHAGEYSLPDEQRHSPHRC